MPPSDATGKAECLIGELDAAAADRKISAFQDLLLFLQTPGVWNELDDETKNRMRIRFLEFLKSNPRGSTPETLEVCGVPLLLVIRAALKMPDPVVQKRIEKMWHSRNANIQGCVYQARNESLPKEKMKDPAGGNDKSSDLFFKKIPPHVLARPGFKKGMESGPALGRVGVTRGDYGFISGYSSRTAPAPIPKLSTVKNKERVMGNETRFVVARPAVKPRDTPPEMPRVPSNMPLEEMVVNAKNSRGDEPAGARPQDRDVPGSVSLDAATAPKRYVNTGFVTDGDPEHSIPQNKPLKTNAKYYFVFSIGKKTDWSGTAESGENLVPVMEGTPLRVDIDCKIGNLTIPAGADIGELEIRGTGATVTRQPGESVHDVPSSKYKQTCLYFPILTPATKETCTLTCTVLYKQAILQRWCVKVEVRENPEQWKQYKIAWSTDPDYAVADKFVPELFSQLQEHRASFFFDIGTQGGSWVYIYGKDGAGNPVKDKIEFQANALQGLIDGARVKLWETEFKRDTNGNISYTYKDGLRDITVLKEGLLNLAEWGCNFYVKLFSDCNVDKTEVARMLESPSYIQIAMRDNPQNFFPAALVYDFPLDTMEKHEEYTLCPQFCTYLENGTDLEKITCYGDKCNAKRDPRKRTICPMGFWGFRHYLNIPLAVKGETPPTRIPVTDGLKVVVATAEELDEGNTHLDAIRNLVETSRSRYSCATLEQALTEAELVLKMNESPHIVYFFCHGKTKSGDIPFIEAGPVNNTFNIDLVTFKNITPWGGIRPLIFINGCHTGDAEPRKYLDYIKPLIVDNKAAGVVGTEITVYASMASLFAEKCLAAFLAGGTIAEAIRGARLKVLSTYNPLGLVYNPFISGGIRLG